jgi:anti-sigma28 factor (negative regulator of flagellin synthesis)
MEMLPGKEGTPYQRKAGKLMQIKSISAAYGAKPLEATVKSGRKAAPEKMAAVPSEQVEFSEASQSLQKLTEVVDSIPEVRIKLVEEIKLKIKHNGYPLESNFYKAMEKILKENII